MKILTSFLIITFSFLLLSCQKQEHPENTHYSFGNKHFNSSILHAENEVIFEVTSDFESNLLWMRGNLVNFRLYSSGFAEFDDCPSESLDGKQIVAEKSCFRHSTKISNTELNELNKLLKSKDFELLTSSYRKIESSCDAIPKVKVQTKNKIIRIDWCDSLTHPFQSPTFPNVLSKIFQQNREIRNKYLGKEVLSP